MADNIYKKNRRRLFAYDRSYQIKYLLLNDTLEIIALGMAVFYMFFLLLFQISKTKVFHAAWSDNLTFNISVLIIIFFIFVFYRVIIRSHQIAGPFVRMERQFNEMKNGDISSDFYLRKSDRLTKLSKSFQEMKEGLRELIQKDRDLADSSIKKLENLEKKLESGADHRSVQSLINDIKIDIEKICKVYALSDDEKINK